jgi:hypothetical protein
MEDYYVVSAGKVVAPDRAYGLVPAGVRVAWTAATGANVVLRYTADDVAARVVDLGTGTFVTVAKTYTHDQLLLQLQELGLLLPTEGLEAFIGNPIGVASGNYIKAAGTDLEDPSTWGFHNYKMQDHVSVTCDYVLRLPLVPFAQESVNLVAFSDAFALADLDGESATVGTWGTLARFQTQMDRYDNDTNANAVGFATSWAPCASWTDNTPLVITDGTAVDITSTVLVRSRGSVTALSQAGDYFWDAEVGVLWFYETGANALPTGLTANDDISFYHYRAVPATVTTYAAVVGNVKAGDFLTYDVNSNLALSANFVAGDFPIADNPTDGEVADIMNGVLNRVRDTLGQVLGFWNHPRSGLEKVRTAYPSLGVLDRMPGSATKGLPDAVTYTGAADKEVIVNLFNR